MKKLYLILFLLISFSATAATVTDSPVTPTHRTDGTPVGKSEIKQITIYCGGEAQGYPDTIHVEKNITLPNTVMTFDITTGIHECVYTAHDIDDRQSPYGNKFFIEADAKASLNAPFVPVGHRIKITITIPISVELD